MTTGFLALTAVVAAIVVVLWLVWRGRERERQRAERAEVTADRWRALIEGSDDLAHDVNGLLSAAFVNLESLADVDEENQDREALEDVTQAIMSAIETLRALRGDVEGSFEGVSTEGLVRLHASLCKVRVPVDLRIEGDLSHHGHGDAAARAIANLFDNARREAMEAGGEIVVELTASALRLTNRIRDPAKLEGDIYARGTSHDGSTGSGLHVCRQMAERAGWRLSHSVSGEHVTFELADDPS